MKTFQIIAFAGLALLAVSCGNSSDKEEKADDRFVDKVDAKTGISSLKPYSDKDSVTVDGKSYQYSFTFHSVDSLQHVTYEATGTEYLDNAAELVIKRGGEVVMKKTFTKATFRSHVPVEFYKTSGLIGFTYNIDRKLNHEENAFYFIATIGNLDDPEENGYSLEVKIDTAGGMTITKYEESETEPQSQGLTIDPDEEGV